MDQYKAFADRHHMVLDQSAKGGAIEPEGHEEAKEEALGDEGNNEAREGHEEEGDMEKVSIARPP